jgi:hypothetical protein
MNITEFLEARIAEDEAEAGSGWSTLGDTRWERDNYGRTMLTPSAVLAECAAKRAIIEEHSPVDYSGIGMKSPNACNLCGVEKTISDWEWDENSFPCKTLRAIAAVYKEHREYQEEWAL